MNQSSSFQLVVFDIAGTTVTDKGNVNDAFRGAFEKAGYPVALSEVDKVMGYRKIEAIKMLLQRFYPAEINNGELIHSIHDCFTEDMQRYYRHTPQLAALPYAEEVFRLLQKNKVRVALNTGFTKVITDTILQRLGWDTSGLVDRVISSDEVPTGRPDPSMIQTIMQQLHISDTGRVAKVGDTEVDIAEGRNAGCGLVIAVTTGAYSREALELYAPDHIISSLQELPALLNITA